MDGWNTILSFDSQGARNVRFGEGNGKPPRDVTWQTLENFEEATRMECLTAGFLQQRKEWLSKLRIGRNDYETWWSWMVGVLVWW